MKGDFDTMSYPEMKCDEDGERIEITLPEDRALRICKDINQVLVIDYFQKQGVWLKFEEIEHLYEKIESFKK